MMTKNTIENNSNNLAFNIKILFNIYFIAVNENCD
jgi:hypothetical protein